MPGPFDLVIFDCDGVLVDSERPAVRIEAEALAALGWPLPESDIVDRFVGRSDAYMQSEIERHIGRPVDWEIDRFAGRIFSTSDVENGKPAPDLFLHAARQMGAEPMRCAVIEDSASGVEAGVAAGMSVFAFAGGVTPRSKLARSGVELFDAMGALPGLLSRSTPGSGA
jgi:beta-phosphoglucomutase-like phosphatase (HAD superfamily)